MDHKNNATCRVCLCEITDVKRSIKPEVMTTCASIQAQKRDCAPEETCSKCLSSQTSDIKIKTECDEMYIEESVLNLGNLGAYVKEEPEETQAVYFEGIESNLVKSEYDNEKDPLHIGAANNVNNDEFLIETPSSYKKGKIKNPLHKKRKEQHEFFQCYVCNKQFRSKSYLVRHLKVHRDQKPFKCDMCDKEFRRVCTLKLHKQVHVDTREKCYKCDVCSKGFYMPGALKIHKKIHAETREKNYKCDVCCKEFYMAAALKRHKKTHLGEMFECDMCDSKFNQEVNLRLHMQRHYKCDVCRKDFYTADVLEKHQEHCRF